MTPSPVQQIYMAMMSLAVEYLLLFLTLTSLCSAQAPGDEAARCTIDHSNPPVYPDNERTLMDSYSYVNLLPGNGTGQPPEDDAVWNDMSFDENDLTDTLNPTYVSSAFHSIGRHCVGRAQVLYPHHASLHTHKPKAYSRASTLV